MFPLKRTEQLHDLRLDRYIKRSQRLIADEELRIHSVRPGNADSLALTAGKFMRISVHHILIDSYFFQKGSDVILHLPPAAEHIVYFQRLCDQFPYCHLAVKGCAGILGYELDLLGKSLFHFTAPAVSNIHTVIYDASFHRAVHPKYASSQCCLAASGSSHQAEDLSPPHFEADIFNRLDNGSPPQFEVVGKIPHCEDRGAAVC